MKRLKMVVSGMIFAAGMGGMAMAGSINSPGAPGSEASKMPALGNIYTYLTTGTPVPTPGTSFTEPSSSPAGTGHTLTDIYEAVATPFPQCDASVSNLISGKKFFCTVAGSWGLKTGTLAPKYCTLLKTGQTSVYYTGDDAANNKGKAFSYTASSGNSVFDNVTGLMWAQDGYGAGCYSGWSQNWGGAVDWAVRLTFDGYSDWRLPNATELQSILVRNVSPGSPYINKTYFSAKSGYYWSSTTCASTTDYAVSVEFNGFGASNVTKGAQYYVRAVREGE